MIFQIIFGGPLRLARLASLAPLGEGGAGRSRDTSFPWERPKVYAYLHPTYDVF